MPMLNLMGLRRRRVRCKTPPLRTAWTQDFRASPERQRGSTEKQNSDKERTNCRRIVVEVIHLLGTCGGEEAAWEKVGTTKEVLLGHPVTAFAMCSHTRTEMEREKIMMSRRSRRERKGRGRGRGEACATRSFSPIFFFVINGCAQHVMSMGVCKSGAGGTVPIRTLLQACA